MESVRILDFEHIEWVCSSLKSDAVFLHQHFFLLFFSLEFFTAKNTLEIISILKSTNKQTRELKAILQCKCMNNLGGGV